MISCSCLGVTGDASLPGDAITTPSPARKWLARLRCRLVVQQALDGEGEPGERGVEVRDMDLKDVPV